MYTLIFYWQSGVFNLFFIYCITIRNCFPNLKYKFLPLELNYLMPISERFGNRLRKILVNLNGRNFSVKTNYDLLQKHSET